MLDLRKRTNSSPTNRLKVNCCYHSEVTGIEWVKGSIKKSMFDVYYSLADENGEVFEYKERFFNRADNLRCTELFDYLLAHDIEDLFDFIGCHEELTFGKNVKHNRVFLEISERKFLGIKETAS